MDRQAKSLLYVLQLYAFSAKLPFLVQFIAFYSGFVKHALRVSD